MYNQNMKALFTFSLLLSLFAGLSANAASEKTTFYHTDALGSIVAASDEPGALLWKKTYDPYGNEVISNEDGEEFEGQAYTGKPYDKETGLLYLSQRYYDPQLRQFMSIDPVGFKASNPTSYNRYAYANNNPYKFIDPDGRESQFFAPFSSFRDKAKNGSNDRVVPWHESQIHKDFLTVSQITGEVYIKEAAPKGMIMAATSLPPVRAARVAVVGGRMMVATKGAGVWKLSPIQRGNAIEAQLAKTDYKGWFNVGSLNNGFFPLVDFQKGSTLVSLKSVNTAGSTWLSRMQSHIRDLGSRGRRSMVAQRIWSWI